MATRRGRRFRIADLWKGLIDENPRVSGGYKKANRVKRKKR